VKILEVEKRGKFVRKGPLLEDREVAHFPLHVASVGKSRLTSPASEGQGKAENSATRVQEKVERRPRAKKGARENEKLKRCRKVSLPNRNDQEALNGL